MGELLFTKDFANVVFDEAYCEFFIKDKLIFSDNILLKSNLVNLSGSARSALTALWRPLSMWRWAMNSRRDRDIQRSPPPW